MEIGENLKTHRPALTLPLATAAWFIAVEIWVSSVFFSFQFVVNHEVEGTHGP